MASDAIVPVGAAPLRELIDADPILRALLKKRYLNTEQLREAFMLRTNETGLSVCFDCNPSEVYSLLEMDMYGVAQLIVGDVRQLGLKVVPDEPHHADITGMPHKETNETEAERLASALARLATIVDRTVHQKAKP